MRAEQFQLKRTEIETGTETETEFETGMEDTELGLHFRALFPHETFLLL